MERPIGVRDYICFYVPRSWVKTRRFQEENAVIPLRAEGEEEP
jgi:hypothetical protein